jgi:Uma2 family endonuclease
MLPVMPSAERRIRPVSKISTLHNGDSLDQKTFHKLYEQTPEGFHAQLIGGIVYVASPVHFPHSNPDGLIQSWLWAYQAETPGIGVINKTTTILGATSEPEPDGGLFILPTHGGHCTTGGKTLKGAPELLIEVANSSAAIDLNQKKRDYETYGVQEYLVVLAEEQAVIWWQLVDGVYQEIPASSDGYFYSVIFPGLWLDAAGLFETTNKKLIKALAKGVESSEHAAFVTKLAAAAKRSKRKKT